MPDHPIILFDGICNLCNSSVQYVINHDPAGLFVFAALQSETGKRLLQEYKFTPVTPDSFILIENGKAYTRSTAALKVAKRLNGPVKLLYGFIIVPIFIRNGVYNMVARNRYKWFGKKESCMIPTPSVQSRFLN